MWIDTHCTKPCSVVISRISNQPKVLKSQPPAPRTSAEVPVTTTKKFHRTSFERRLLSQSSRTGQERKSTRLHGPKSRLRSRKVLNYSTNMPATVNKDSPTSSCSDEKSKAKHSSAFSKVGEWQKSVSSNPFKLRLKCLNKDKQPHLQQRKWTLQENETSKNGNEEKSGVHTVNTSAVPECTQVDSKAELKTRSEHVDAPEGTKPVSTVTKRLRDKPDLTVQKRDKSPLSKLVISCKKDSQIHQASFSKSDSVKSEDENKPEASKVHRKMAAYTVYTKLKENSIESIDCKRFKKRKYAVRETRKRKVRESKVPFSSLSFRHKYSGSVEEAVRATLESLLRDVVAAELDQMLSLESPGPQIQTLLQSFCHQYGYNYDKDFCDPQNSILHFSIASSPPALPKPKEDEQTNISRTRDVESRPPSVTRTLRRRRKRKLDSSDDSDDEHENPEMISAMMRSMSNERRVRLSRKAKDDCLFLNYDDSKSMTGEFIPTEHFFPVLSSNDSDQEDVPSCSKLVINSPSENVPSVCPEHDEDTDCSDSELTKGIPPSTLVPSEDKLMDDKREDQIEIPVREKEIEQTEPPKKFKPSVPEEETPIPETVMKIDEYSGHGPVVKILNATRDKSSKEPTRGFLVQSTKTLVSEDFSPSQEFVKPVKQVHPEVIHKQGNCASMPNLTKIIEGLQSKSTDCVESQDTSSLVNSSEVIVNPKLSKDLRSCDSPDLDSDSDNLVICLETQPNTDSVSEEPSQNTEKNPSKTPERQILYHTPRFPITENPGTDGFLPASPKNPLRINPPMPNVDQKPYETSEGIRKELANIEKNAVNQAPRKPHHTPVQKVLPQVQTQLLSPKENLRMWRNVLHSKGGLTIQHDPISQAEMRITAVGPIIPPDLLLPSTIPSPTIPLGSEAKTSATRSPLTRDPSHREVLDRAPDVCITPSTLGVPGQAPPIMNIPPLTAVSVGSVNPIQVVSNSITVPGTASPVKCTSTMIETGPTGAITVPRVSVPVSPLTVSTANLNSGTICSRLSPDLKGSIPDISQLTNSNCALDISILRTLLLDPPPEGSTIDVENLMFPKGKEPGECNKTDENNFSLPVITSVMSLNVEATKNAIQANESSTTSPNHKRKEHVPTVKSSAAQGNIRVRNTDSPEIVEEKFKPSVLPPRSSLSGKAIMTPRDGINDLLHSLQMEIRDLDKMAEDKKKEYLLIMYVRKYKSDTLRRLQESLRRKEATSPEQKRATTAEPILIPHAKETCLVRPMVQPQPEHMPLPSPNSLKPPDIRPTISPSTSHRAMTISQLLMESQARAQAHPQENRQKLANNTPPIHSSQSSLNKMDLDFKTGFRPYLSPTGMLTNNTNNDITKNPSTEPAPQKVSDPNYVNFMKFDPGKTQPRNIMPYPGHQSGTLTPSGLIASTNKQTPALPPATSHPPSSTSTQRPSIASWKGTVSAYRKAEAKGWNAKDIIGPGDSISASSCPNAPRNGPVESISGSTCPNAPRNIIGQQSASSTAPIPTFVRDFPAKCAENSNRTPAAQGPSASPFMDFHPFSSLAAASTYFQSFPFWAGSVPVAKPNTSMASLHAARELYMHSLNYNARNHLRTEDSEQESQSDKIFAEKLRSALSTSGSSLSAGTVPDQQSHHTLGGVQRPFLYGNLRKCVVCKVADAQFICSGCGKDWYCSQTCQRQNWRVHSRSCISSST